MKRHKIHLMSTSGAAEQKGALLKSTFISFHLLHIVFHLTASLIDNVVKTDKLQKRSNFCFILKQKQRVIINEKNKTKINT